LPEHDLSESLYAEPIILPTAVAPAASSMCANTPADEEADLAYPPGKTIKAPKSIDFIGVKLALRIDRIALFD
jgi:hypothetical protein